MKVIKPVRNRIEKELLEALAKEDLTIDLRQARKILFAQEPKEIIRKIRLLTPIYRKLCKELGYNCKKVDPSYYLDPRVEGPKHWQTMEVRIGEVSPVLLRKALLLLSTGEEAGLRKLEEVEGGRDAIIKAYELLGREADYRLYRILSSRNQ